MATPDKRAATAAVTATPKLRKAEKKAFNMAVKAGQMAMKGGGLEGRRRGAPL